MCGINDCLEFRVYCEPTHVTRQTATNIALQATPGEQRKKGKTFRLYLVCACTCRGGVRGLATQLCAAHPELHRQLSWGPGRVVAYHVRGEFLLHGGAACRAAFRGSCVLVRHSHLRGHTARGGSHRRLAVLFCVAYPLKRSLGWAGSAGLPQIFRALLELCIRATFASAHAFKKIGEIAQRQSTPILTNGCATVAPSAVARSASASAASNSCSPELAAAVAEGACPLPSSRLFVHRARSSAASTGLRKPPWRSLLPPFCNSAPNFEPTLYTPSKPVEFCDDPASTSPSTCVAPCDTSHCLSASAHVRGGAVLDPPAVPDGAPIGSEESDERVSMFCTRSAPLVPLPPGPTDWPVELDGGPGGSDAADAMAVSLLAVMRRHPLGPAPLLVSGEKASAGLCWHGLARCGGWLRFARCASGGGSTARAG
eukprot:scaffold133299_cov68-Phaeocystis_antarctica.AAC.4